jgi:aerobic-type carbon monoxide dehydrogenase small subunit (CoxS/CutS family)
MSEPVTFVLNGRPVSVPAEHETLLQALRDGLGVRSAKDGCSPQGQCGCCTVWIDGQPRVACVTALNRVSGRVVTTIEGLDDADEWAARFTRSGASQCGFCTPGIIMRLAGLGEPGALAAADVTRALSAHLCRCTGWQTIVEAVGPKTTEVEPDRIGAEQRARLEGGVAQRVEASVALGHGGFADDEAPIDSLVAVCGDDGAWHVAETLPAARHAAARTPGRKSTVPISWPLDLPPGPWARTLQTTWVEPGYLEPDASWCAPGGESASSLANGGAFGAKQHPAVADVARRLADEHGRAVRVLWQREDVVRCGPKRPPVAAGIRADGTGVIRVVHTPGVSAAIAAVAPDLEVIEIDVPGPATSVDLRGAGWVEAAVLLASLKTHDTISSPNGAVASAVIDEAGVRVEVRAGRILDAVVLRSYCIGAAHQALGWVRSEGLAVNADGVPQSLTIRSFGILTAAQTPPIEVHLIEEDRPAVNGSDAVFAAVAAAAWRASGYRPRWPLSASL